MSELINLFTKLSEFYSRDLHWEQVEELYEKQSESKNKEAQAPKRSKIAGSVSAAEGCDDEPLSNMMASDGSVASLPFIQRALNDAQVISTLLELCTTIRNLRGESSVSYDNTYDSWDQVVKASPRDAYLAFIYALAGLVTLDATSAVYIKLSLTAVNTYFLSLTIPGAKGYHIFEEEIITHCLQVFTLVERIQNPDVLKCMTRQQPVEIWVRLVALCDDLKLLLRYVHFSDHEQTRNAFLKKLVDIQYLNHERGYANHCE